MQINNGENIKKNNNIKEMITNAIHINITIKNKSSNILNITLTFL